MQDMMPILLAPVNTVRGILGFTTALVVVPFVLGPVRRARAVHVGSMDPEAKRLAKLSSIMYQPEDNRRGQFEQEGWILLQNHEKYAIAKRRATILVAFQGTKQTKDLFDDAKILLNLNDHIDVTEIKRHLYETLGSCHHIVVTGHSLGGCVANPSRRIRAFKRCAAADTSSTQGAPGIVTR